VRRICRIAATGRAAGDSGSCAEVVEHGSDFFNVIRGCGEQLFGAFEQGGQGRGRELTGIRCESLLHITRCKRKFHIPNDFLRGRRYLAKECDSSQAAYFRSSLSVNNEMLALSSVNRDLMLADDLKCGVAATSPECRALVWIAVDQN
jgi:hypothetical protein